MTWSSLEFEDVCDLSYFYKIKLISINFEIMAKDLALVHFKDPLHENNIPNFIDIMEKVKLVAGPNHSILVVDTSKVIRSNMFLLKNLFGSLLM